MAFKKAIFRIDAQGSNSENSGSTSLIFRPPMAKVTKSPSAGCANSSNDPFLVRSADLIQPQTQNLNVYWRPRRETAQAAYNIPLVKNSNSPKEKSGFPKKYFRSRSQKDAEKGNSFGDSSGDESSPGNGVSNRRGSLLDGFKDLITPRARPRSSSDAGAARRILDKKALAKKRSPSPRHSQIQTEEPMDSDYIDEARDQAKPLFVNTRLANLIAEDSEKPAGNSLDRRRRSAGPLSDMTRRVSDELTEEDVEPASRPRSYSGGSVRNNLRITQTSGAKIFWMGDGTPTTFRVDVCLQYSYL